MKKRYVYSLLFGIPGFFVSLIVAVSVSGATSGFLWIFVFGDNPWPASSEKILAVIFILGLVVSWSALIATGYVIGKNLEQEPGVNTRHIMLSALATIVPIAVIGLQQWKAGNIGPLPDTVRCSQFCREKGYPGSGMPPRDSGERTCSCFGNDGRETIKVPIYNIGSD